MDTDLLHISPSQIYRVLNAVASAVLQAWVMATHQVRLNHHKIFSGMLILPLKEKQVTNLNALIHFTDEDEDEVQYW